MPKGSVNSFTGKLESNITRRIMINQQTRDKTMTKT